MVYEMRETHRKKKWAEFLWGRKAWRVGLCGSGNFTLSPRYKVQGMHDRDREGFYFYFYFYFYLFLFFLFKRLQSDTDALSQKKKRKKKKKENQQ